jgi:ribosomal protein S8E
MDPRKHGDGERVDLVDLVLSVDATAFSFVSDRLRELPEDAQPTSAEREALERRMRAALLTPDGRVDDDCWFIVSQTNAAGTEVVRFMAPRSSAQARVWPSVFREWQLERVPGLAARAVLNKVAATDKRATHAAAEEELTRVIRAALPSLLAELGDTPGEDATARAVAWLKARPLAKVDAFARRVEEGRERASPRQWADPWTAARFIGGAFWTLKVRDNLPRYTRPGLDTKVLTNLTKLRSLQKDADLSQRRSLTKGTAVETWVGNVDGKTVVGVDLPKCKPPPNPVVALDVLSQPVVTLDEQQVNPGLLRSVTAIRLMRFVMHRSHDQYRETGDITQATRVTVRGGWRGLAKKMREGTGDKAAARTRETARALQSAWMKTPTGGEGGLLMVHHQPRGPGQPFEEVTITLNDKGPLSPLYSVRELHGRSPKIVPVPLPELLPPMVGRPNEHGAIATLQMLVLRELALDAKTLVEMGGIPIPAERWREMARECGVPLLLLDDLKKAWCDGDPAAPAFITMTGDMVNLADAYNKERLFLEDGGRLSLDGQRRARKPKLPRGRGK